MNVVKRNVYKRVDIAVKNYDSFFRMRENTSQWAFTWSKLTIETLEQGEKYVQS